MVEIVAYKGQLRVSLGVMQEHHITDFALWANQPGIEGTMIRPPYTTSGGLKWLRSLDKRHDNDVFAMLLHNESAPELRYIGHTGIHNITWPDGFGTSGSVMGDPAARAVGGLGTEAKLLLLYHAFRVRGLRKVLSSVKAFNSPSLGHLIKCGYRVVGRRLDHHFHNGAYVDEILLEVFREAWEPIWDAYQSTHSLPKLTAEQRELVRKITSS